jgi:hypothetical protein
MRSEKYVKEVIWNMHNWLKERNCIFETRAPSILPTGYKLELDNSPYYDEEESHYYSKWMGVLRWAVELSHVAIVGEVSMMAAFIAAPQRGHFEAMLHIFSYLKTHEQSKLIFDKTYMPVEGEIECD